MGNGGTDRSNCRHTHQKSHRNKHLIPLRDTYPQRHRRREEHQRKHKRPSPNEIAHRAEEKDPTSITRLRGGGNDGSAFLRDIEFLREEVEQGMGVVEISNLMKPPL